MKTNTYLKPLPSFAWVCFFNETNTPPEDVKITPDHSWLHFGCRCSTPLGEALESKTLKTTTT